MIYQDGDRVVFNSIMGPMPGRVVSVVTIRDKDQDGDLGYLVSFDGGGFGRILATKLQAEAKTH